MWGTYSLRFLGNPTTDPEVASSCIELADKMVPRYLEVFLYPQCFDSTPLLFAFSLRCLTATEIMPKRAAAQFWVGNYPYLVQKLLLRLSLGVFRAEIRCTRDS